MPYPNRSEVTHAVRTLNDKIWDSPKSYVWEEYLRDHPQGNIVDTTDFLKWYYAGFTLLDKEANKKNTIFEKQIQERNTIIDKWSWVAPAAKFHEKLSSISETDRQSHVEFKAYVMKEYLKLRSFYYSKIFEDELFSSDDIDLLSKKLDDNLSYKNQSF